MVTRRGPALKRLRYYLSLLPPERPIPDKKLNTASRAVLDTKTLRDGLTSALEDVQQGLLASYLRNVWRNDPVHPPR